MRAIDADALVAKLDDWRGDIEDVDKNDAHDVAYYSAMSRAIRLTEAMPTLDLAPVMHGEWKLKANAFYADNLFEEEELCVYIVANCGACGCKHPNSHQVYSKHVYVEDGCLPLNIEHEKQVALKEFRQMNYQFANYCPNCGAKMNGGKTDGRKTD